MVEMKWRALVLALVACSSDPTLHVVVVHPTGLTVESTTVTVYTSKTFGCKEIEYGEVEPTALQAALVAEETIDASGTKGGLVGLSRTDDKLIVARGYDDAGGLVAAGCVDKGVVSGAATVEVDTEVAALVSLALIDASGTMGDIYGITATVTDPSGHELDGRQVWWRVYGPAGTQPDARAPMPLTAINDGVWEPTQPTCSRKGFANIHPVPPSLMGGFEVEVRVSWSVEPPKLFSSFTKIGLGLTPVTLPVGVSGKFCARNTPNLVCLDNTTGTLVASTYTASVSGGMATVVKGSATSVPQDAIALYDLNNGTQVFAATATCAIAPVAGGGSAHVGSCVGADDILLVPSCGSTSAKLLFHIPGGIGVPDQIRAIDLATGQAGNVTINFSGAENRAGLGSAGCVTELDPNGGAPGLRQVIVLDFSRDNLVPTTRALYGCPSSCVAIPLPVALAGVGFTSGAESRIVVPSVDAAGVELAQNVLIPDPNGGPDHLVDRADAPAASVPIEIVAGNFDDDDGPDLMWDFSSRKGTAFEISYARLVNGVSLEAVSPGQLAVADHILVGDVTNDSYDDLVVLGTTIEAVPKRGIAVVPTRVQPPDPSLKPDTTCTP